MLGTQFIREHDSVDAMAIFASELFPTRVSLAKILVLAGVAIPLPAPLCTRYQLGTHFTREFT